MSDDEKRKTTANNIVAVLRSQGFPVIANAVSGAIEAAVAQLKKSDNPPGFLPPPPVCSAGLSDDRMALDLGCQVSHSSRRTLIERKSEALRGDAAIREFMDEQTPSIVAEPLEVRQVRKSHDRALLK